jgi:hypothetical protein
MYVPDHIPESIEIIFGVKISLRGKSMSYSAPGLLHHQSLSELATSELKEKISLFHVRVLSVFSAKTALSAC